MAAPVVRANDSSGARGTDTLGADGGAQWALPWGCGVTQVRRFTSADLELFPDGDGKRYEIIDGQLFLSKQPAAGHQLACIHIATALDMWNAQGRSGVVRIAPGVVFADDDDVAPDLVWLSRERLA